MNWLKNLFYPIHSEKRFNLGHDVPEIDYPYEFSFNSRMTTRTLPQQLLPEVVEWFEENLHKPAKLIYEMGDLWGVAISDKDEAMLFKLTWG